MKRRRKRLIIILSLILTVTTALVLFSTITGFSFKALLFGTTSSGIDAVEETNLSTTSKKNPTDGSLPTDYSALDNMAFLVYKAEEESYFSSTVKGTAYATFKGISVKQSVDDYRVVTPEYSFVDTRSKSTFVKLYEQRFITNDKVLYRSAKSENYSSVAVQARSLAQEFLLNGYGPDKLTGYIICEETITNTPEVLVNEDGTYTLSLELDTNVAPAYYQRKVKTSSGSNKAPKFVSINLTYKFDSNWNIITCDTSEIYDVFMLGDWATTNNVITETFTYDKNLEVPEYDFYKDYFGMEVEADNLDNNVQVEKTVIDYLGQGFTQYLNGNINVSANITIDGKEILAQATIDMLNGSAKIKINDNYIAYENNKLYLTGDNNSYYDINDLKPIISLINGLYALSPSYVEKAGSSSDISSIINTDDLMNQLMDSEIIKNENIVTINSNLEIMGFNVPVFFNFDCPDEDTINLIDFGTEATINKHRVSAEISLDTKTLVDFNIDDTFEKIDLAANVDVSASLKYEDLIYQLTGNLYLDLYNVRFQFDGTIQVENEILTVSLTLYDENIYVNINNIYFKISFDEIRNIIALSSVSSSEFNTSNYDLNSILDFINSEDHSNIRIADLELLDLKFEIKENSYGQVNIPSNTDKYITIEELKDIYDVYSTIKDDLMVNVNLEFDYLYGNVNTNVILEGNYYVNNSELELILTLTTGEKTINVKAYYKDRIIYISYNDLGIKFDTSKTLELLPNNNEINISVNYNNIIKYVFKVLDSVSITNNMGNINIDILIDEILLSFDLEALDDSISLNLSNTIINNLFINKMDITLLSVSDEMEIIGEFQPLSLVSEGGLSFNLEYNDEVITFNGEYYFNLNEKEFIINVSSVYKNEEVTLDVIYKEGILYVKLNEVKVKASIEELSKYLNFGSVDSNNEITNFIINGINIDINNNVLNFSIENISINNIKISDININYMPARERVIIIEDNYVSLSEISDLANRFNEILSSEYEISANLEFSTIVKEKNISGQVNLVYNSNNVLYAQISIEIDSIYELVEIIYDDSNVYISYKDYKLYVNINDLAKIIGDNTLNPTVSSLNIDILSVLYNLLNSINLESNEEINITLESLITDLSDISISVSNYDSINVNIEQISYKNYNLDNVNLSIYDYITLSEVDYSVYDYISFIFDSNINMSVMYKDIELNVNANIYIDLFKMESLVSGYISTDGSNIEFRAIILNNNIYVEIGEMNFVITYDEIKDLLNTNSKAEVNSNLIKDLINMITIDRNTLSIDNITINDLYIYNTNITISNAVNKEIVLKDNYVSFSVIKDTFDSFMNVFKDQIQIEVNTIVKVKGVQIKVAGVLYFDLLTKCSNGDFTITIGGTEHDISFMLFEEKFYFTYGNLGLALSVDEIFDVLTYAEERLEFTTNTKLPELSISTIMDIINSLKLIDNSDYLTLSISLSNLMNNLNDLVLDISSLDTITIKMDSYVYEDILLDNTMINISKSNNSIEIPAGNYIEYEEILTVIDYASYIKELISSDNFNVSFSTNIYNNDKLRYIANASIYVNKLVSSKFNLYVELDIISQNDKDSSYTINFTIIDSYVYIDFKDSLRDSNKDFLNVKCSISDGLSIIGTVAKFLGIENDLLNSFITSEIASLDLNELGKLNFGGSIDFKTIKFSDYIEGFNVASDKSYLSLVLNGQKLFNSNNNVQIVLSALNENIQEISITNIYSHNTSTRVEKFDMYFEFLNDVVIISAPDGDYIDVSSVNDLLAAFLNTASLNDFDIKGTLNVNLNVIGIDIDMSIGYEVRVVLDENKNPEIWIYLEDIPVIPGVNDDVPYSFGNTVSGIYAGKNRNLSIYISNGNTYIYRTEKVPRFASSDATYEKMVMISTEEFMGDLLNYLCSYGLGFSDSIMEAITAGIGQTDHEMDLANLIADYSKNEDSSYNLKISLYELTGNSDLGYITLTIGTEKVNDKTYLSDLKISVDINLTDPVSLSIVIKSEDSKLINIGESIDMSYMYDYISSYNYGYGEYYGGYNGSIANISTTKYTIEVNPNNGDESYELTGKYKDDLELPEFDYYVSDSIMYKFDGWYYSEEYSDSTLFTYSYFPNGNYKIYAKWVQVSASNINFDNTYDGTLDSIYVASGLEITLPVLQQRVTNNIVYDFVGWSDGLDIYTSKYVVPSADVELTAVWKEVTYNVYVNGVLVSNLYNNDTTTILLENAVVSDESSIMNIYSSLTPQILFSNHTASLSDDGLLYFSDILSYDDCLNDTNYFVLFDDDLSIKGYVIDNSISFSSDLLPSNSKNGYDINTWLSRYEVSSDSLISDYSNIKNQTLYPYYSTPISDFTLSGNTISKYNGSSEKVILPIYNGSEIITNIGNESFMENGLSIIVMTDFITTIGSNAFKNCYSMKEIYMSDNANSIESDAFYYNSGNTKTDVTYFSAITLYATNNFTFDVTTLKGSKYKNNVYCYAGKKETLTAVFSSSLSYDYTSWNNRVDYNKLDIISNILA